MVASAGQGPWSEGSPGRDLTGGGALGPAVIGDDGPCWMVCTGDHCASTGGISGVVLLHPLGWACGRRDCGTKAWPVVARWDRPSLGTTGHAGWCTLEAVARPRAGYPGTGLASGVGVHPCDYEMGSNGTRLALGMLRGDWPARARSGLAPGMPAMPRGGRGDGLEGRSTRTTDGKLVYWHAV